MAFRLGACSSPALSARAFVLLDFGAVAAEQRDRARVEAAKATRISSFLEEMLRAPDPVNQGRDVKLVDALDRAARRLQSEKTSDAEVQVPIRRALGLTYYNLGLYDAAETHLRAALSALRGESPEDHDLRMDWEFDGEEFDEESKLRAETRKIMELPDLPIQATCVRVPVMVGHAEAVWIETEDELTPERATELLGAAPSVRLEQFPSPGKSAGLDEVLVGRIRRDPTVERGLALFLASDNLRKGAALNAIQIATLMLSGGDAETLKVA